MLSCANDQDTAAFRLSDVAHAARAIMNHCIVGRDPSYGGIVGVSDVPTFYVSVAGPAFLEGNSTIIDGTELEGNITLLDAQLGGNTTLLDTE